MADNRDDDESLGLEMARAAYSRSCGCGLRRHLVQIDAKWGGPWLCCLCERCDAVASRVPPWRAKTLAGL